MGWKTRTLEQIPRGWMLPQIERGVRHLSEGPYYDWMMTVDVVGDGQVKARW